MAVLDFHDSSAGDVKSQEVLYLSDLVRGAARRTLSADRFLLMTRENIQELLPQGRSLADCVGDCAVETGRKIGADYVVTGDVTSFGGQVRVTVNLHEVGGGNLLGQVVAGAPDVLGVEGDLKMKVLELLAPLREGGVPADGGEVTEGRIGGGATAWSAAGVAKNVVSFASDPPGAMVEIDGQPVGETPCAKALAVGVYRVGIKMVRYVAHAQAIEVKAGVSPKVSVTLTPDFGWLTVESDPVGLAVTIDSEAAGSTPLTAREVSPGPHEVMVTAENFHDEGRRVVVDRGEREIVRVNPVPRNGGVTVIANDPKGSAVDAVVKIEGRIVGKAYEPITLLRGRHELTVESASGIWKGEVMVVEEQLAEIVARLEPTLAPIETVSGSLEMVSVPAGIYMMGSLAWDTGRNSDEAQHRVELTHAFLIAVTEVSQSWYANVMGTNPSQFSGDDLPVERVSWLDAVQFCNKLSVRDGLQPAYRIAGSDVAWDRTAPGYRLPTEVEWEYACRAGTTTEYSYGHRDSDLDRAGWYSGNAGGKTHPVGTSAPNRWGLYDMHGNVWEWCWDWYGDYDLTLSLDPQGAPTGSRRVNRGGGWGGTAKSCRSANRECDVPSMALSFLGFRVVRGAVQ